jgi:MFS superfamily sulfate permease-like transporter
MAPGGLAGQYYFGARTGGTNLIEGTLEIVVGLFLASSIAHIFAVFPLPIIGAMMFMVGIELSKFAKDVRVSKRWLPAGVTLIVSVITNMAFGFLAGIGVYYPVRFIVRKRGRGQCYLQHDGQQLA